MKLRYIIILPVLVFLAGCTDATVQQSYTLPTQKEIAPIERQAAPPSPIKFDEPQIEKQQVTPPSSVSADSVQTEKQKEVDVPLSNDNYYTNSVGNTVHSPAYAPSIPAGASARCRDGTYSFSQSRRGTCSHHGGVALWY